MSLVQYLHTPSSKKEQQKKKELRDAMEIIQIDRVLLLSMYNLISILFKS